MDVNLSSVLSVSTDYTLKAASKEEKVSEEEKASNEAAATYEKSDSSKTNTTYTISKMSKEDRSALVEQLKADQEKRQQSLIDLAQNMISKQVSTFATAFGEDDESIWKFLASGKFEADEETINKAKEDVSEEGYYGVKQTSNRLFDFASALAGDDVDKMKEMQEAILKGYKKAEKTWGGELPEISQKTLEATNKLFEDYYNSKDETCDTEE